MNEDDRIAEYAFDDPLGIRRAPYSGYPLSYGDVTGAEVHNDGEIYGAIGWQLLQNFGIHRKRDLFGYIVNGMNFTPPAPTYEQMRDGILQAVSLNPIKARDACDVWSAFAQYGVGVGARGTVRGKTVIITESFSVPPSCK